MPSTDSLAPSLACAHLARRCGGRAGFTVVEAAIAAAIVTLFLTSLFALNSTMMRLLGAAAETASASQDLQQRVEQIRLANWTQITDPTWLKSSLLGGITDASINLPGLQESVTVTAYVSPCTTGPLPSTLPAPFTVTRDAKGKVTVSPSSAVAMGGQEMVQIDLAITWPGWSRSRNRAMTTLVSRWGISK